MHKKLHTLIESDDYARERWEPRIGDDGYLVLSDLKFALDRYASNKKLTVLDYGCGGSPYSGLFGNADYRRADFADGSDLDYIVAPGEELKETDGTFDVILSTQVLEHVEEPQAYLKDCYRLLKYGGRLILSTHGSYEDHSCPHDFQRWTVDGLRRDMAKAGFNGGEFSKITTGPRAALFYYQRYFEQIVLPKHTLLGFLTGIFRRANRGNRRLFHRIADASFPDNRVVRAGDSGQHEFYIVLLASCKKADQPKPESGVAT